MKHFTGQHLISWMTSFYSTSVSPLLVGWSVGLSVAEGSEHATYGDRPCFFSSELGLRERERERERGSSESLQASKQ